MLRGTADSTPEERLFRPAESWLSTRSGCLRCMHRCEHLSRMANCRRHLHLAELTVDYAIAALQNNRHVTEGINDTIHSAALRVHVEQPGPDSARVVDLAMSLMLFLEPEIREVLAHELCLSSIPGSDLLTSSAPGRTTLTTACARPSRLDSHRPSFASKRAEPKRPPKWRNGEIGSTGPLCVWAPHGCRPPRCVAEHAAPQRPHAD